jgi:hypothetical protein
MLSTRLILASYNPIAIQSTAIVPVEVAAVCAPAKIVMLLPLFRVENAHIKPWELQPDGSVEPVLWYEATT